MAAHTVFGPLIIESVHTVFKADIADSYRLTNGVKRF
jgi:hypothetical protein